jgi:hypothetical protein
VSFQLPAAFSLGGKKKPSAHFFYQGGDMAKWRRWMVVCYGGEITEWRCVVRTIITCSFVVVTVCVGLAQSPDSWRGLKLNESTIEDIVSVLGQPNKSKQNQKLHTVVGDWLDKSARYDKLEFRAEGVKKADLYVRDRKLRAIEIELREKLNPNSLAEAYSIDFVPHMPGLEIAFNPRNYERHEGKVYPKQYPLVYQLIGVSESSYIVARVEQGSFSHMGKSITGVEDTGISFPGKVGLIQIISREIKDHRGVDVLK